jgi:cytochrome c biogenesis protein ResB
MLLGFLSSSKMALVLVLLVILFCIVGAVLPQEGGFEPEEIAQWQQMHPTVTTVLGPLGLFHVFHSWLFLVTIVLLGVNTLTCTILHFLKEDGFSALKGPEAIEKAGFFLLHLSLIVLLAGGFWSAATKLDGYIVLTEGQHFTERHDNYLRLVEGPLRREHHEEFVVDLKKVDITYERKRYQTDVISILEVLSDGKKVLEGKVKFNKPFKYKGLSFTQDETGFSPRLIIGDKETGRTLINTFIALKTFRTAEGREYRDFLPLPFLENRIIVTLYPSFTMDKGGLKKNGEEPENPLLLIESEDESGNVVLQRHLLAGQKTTVGNHTFVFGGLRRWSSFKVVEDSGYPIVWVSLWLAVAALLLRYFPDLRRWFRQDASATPTLDV